jgi:hypothetical protein
LISDFIDSGYEKALGIASRKHDLIALKLNDKLESNIPSAGLLRLSDLESGEEILIDTSSRKFKNSFLSKIRKRFKDFDSLMNRYGIDRVYIPADGDYSTPLIRFFQLRSRRIRR